MAIVQHPAPVPQFFTGLSTDKKPTTIAGAYASNAPVVDNAVLYCTDTGAWYVFKSGAWYASTSAAA